MTDHELIEANAYGEGEYGAGAYGADYVPNTTSYHDWRLPDPGATDYPATWDTLADAIDATIPERGPLAQRPAAGTADRPYVETDATDPNGFAVAHLHVDDGSSWQFLDLEDDPDYDAFLHTDREEVISAPWTFDPDNDVPGIDGDITGNAETADHATTVEIARDTDALGGAPRADVNRVDRSRTVTGSHTFRRPVEMDEVDASPGTVLQLPAYDPDDE